MVRNSRASKGQRNRWRKALITRRTTQALVAGHEAAHSIVIIMNRNIPVTFISSTTISREGRDVKELKAVLMATMAGKAVEEKLVGESTGNGDEMEDARQTAKEVYIFVEDWNAPVLFLSPF
ncbi:hypothetical protein niasHT_017006 [Heterodera trifolii]|uniref:Uncharacterized protein n=1 Tax=Heterodera trifolii TaxID=157864 RepID=A0ABD2LAP7_9BILA